jgi:hypothetical protein
MTAISSELTYSTTLCSELWSSLIPEGNIFLCGVAVVEELAIAFAVVLAVGSTLEGFFDRRWSHSSGIATTAY